MSARVALQLNAVIGIVMTAAASSTVWLVLTRPADVAFAIADREYGAMALAIAHELARLAAGLVRFF
jgi:hypothetical protein